MRLKTKIGLGLRRELVPDLLSDKRPEIDFVEFAPENWMGLGGKLGKTFKAIAERYPMTGHGLSLSLGSAEPLDFDFLKRLKKFFQDIPVLIYSEHLSFTQSGNAHLYELLPVPFRQDAAKHIIARLRTAQEILERKIAIENVSYYTPIAPEMDEASFIRHIVEESGCDLLLDVNNVYVNAFNHGYDPKGFIQSLPLEAVAYLHMAGHTQKTPDLIIDTHGEAIIDPVYELFSWTVARLKPVPVLLERDYHIPNIENLSQEISRLRSIAAKKWETADAA